MPTRDPPPALVISLDLELHWGVRDHSSADGPYRANLLGVWQAVPAMLALFEEFEVAATWAAVGFLFARSRAELRELSPEVRPAYLNPALSPFDEPVGESEADDPLHYAPTLLEAIQRSPRQELTTHTFSHYYCVEPGQDRAAFEADLRSAVAIMARYGLVPRSIIFPRNQHNPEYGPALREAGIVCYRGNQRGWMYQAVSTGENDPSRRAARLVDAYASISGPNGIAWDDVPDADGLCNVPASFFLRPYSPRLRRLEPLRMRRLTRAIGHAATHGRIVHLWWHPHNFGTHLDENLRVLRGLLEVFSRYRESHGMRSLTMAEVATIAMERAGRAIPGPRTPVRGARESASEPLHPQPASASATSVVDE